MINALNPLSQTVASSCSQGLGVGSKEKWSFGIQKI